ncbi:MazF family toxin-antitoxin system [Spirochaetia bacterium]|nr:MazF family toxin-antitoxin system [Spirochaetia bacterium]
MSPFDIFVAYISWKTGGKRRPVLIISTGDSNGHTASAAYGFGITTQYDNKSERIKAKYYKIIDWKPAGLEKQSYIDTVRLLKFPPDVVSIAKPIGRLTQEDIELLIAFLEK